MRLDQRCNELAAEPGHVPGEHEKVTVERPERLAGSANRVASSERSFLDRNLDFAEGGAAVRRTDDDDPLGAPGASGENDPVDHAATEQFVEVLGHLRTHPRTETGGENNGGEGCATQGRWLS